MNSNNALGNSNADPIPVHICIYCGHPRRREDVGDVEISAGILRCPKCGFDGPLNIEIRNSPES